MQIRRQQGMTLLEVLIALTIFVLMAGAGYSGLQQALSIESGLEQQRQYWRRLDAAMLLLQQDLDQAINLAPRVPLNEALSFIGNPAADPAVLGGVLLFSRGGNFSFADGPVSPHVRVAWRFREGRLYRVVWPQLNMADRERGSEFELLDGIRDIRVRYLDPTRQWRTLWPAAPGREDSVMPVAVEWQIQLDDEQQYKRVFHVGTLR
jgi:general secretion pathway protein J